MKFSLKDFFINCDQICKKLRIWLHELKESLMENFIFRAVNVAIHLEGLQIDQMTKLLHSSISKTENNLSALIIMTTSFL